jgi:serine/threonine-protein kinase
MVDWRTLDWKPIAILFAKIMGVLLIIFLLFNYVVMPMYTRHGQAIEVPDVTNLMYEEARDRLERLGLEIVEETKKFDSSNQYPIGVIMGQNPRAGSKVKTGRRIYVIVSKGEPMIEMPQLTHRSERNAIFTIKNIGLELRNVNYGHSEIYPEGVVVDQSIPPGAEVKLGTPIDISVSLGRFPDQFIVPNLIGRSLTDARKVILQAGLIIGDISYQEDADLLPETVIHQSLPADEVVGQGTAIDLIVSKLPDREGE